MSGIITDQDMRDEVGIALGDYASEYDVRGIVAELIDRHGRRYLNDIPAADLWGTVSRHALEG